jgi:UDP-N-acetylglucosamine 1-carboxyvinyltransferase
MKGGNQEKFIIKGLAGKKTLSGTIKINGAKNAVLKAMAASVLFENVLRIENVPDTEDVDKMLTLMTGLGITTEMTPKMEMLGIDATNHLKTDLDHDISKSMRASVVITGPLLARFGNVSFPAPGGCVIGTRPIDLFIEGYKKMGATVSIKKHSNGDDRYEITAPKNKKTGSYLRGAEIIFPIQTVGGTETLMMAAVLAEGKTVLKNAAMEPEIVSLIEYLNTCGAHIEGAGTPTLVIHGTGGKLLKTNTKNPYVTIPDRIEAGSFLFLAAACGKDITITDCNPAHLDVVIDMLVNSGVNITTTKNSIHVVASNKKLNSFNIRTHEYPGFPTDVQAPAVVYLTQTEGEGKVFETIFEGRFKYVDQLNRMGAAITSMNPREVLIKGKTPLKALDAGEELVSYDIRAGFAIIIAALIAQGTSVIDNTYFIDRGYEKIEKRLKALGADIVRIAAE